MNKRTFNTTFRKLIFEFYEEHDNSEVDITRCMTLAIRLARLVKDYDNLLWLELCMMDLTDSDKRSYYEFSNHSDSELFSRQRQNALQKLKHIKSCPNEMIQNWSVEALTAITMDIERNSWDDEDNQAERMHDLADNCKTVIRQMKKAAYAYVAGLEERFAER